MEGKAGEPSFALIGRTYTFITKLSAQECAERLQRSAKPVPVVSFAVPKEETFYLKLRGTRFQLAVDAPGDWRNSFRPLFYGLIRATPDGTRIDGCLRPHSVAIGFMVAWFLSLLAFAGHLVAAALAGSGEFNVHPIAALRGPLVGVLGGIAVVVIGHKLGKRQRAALVSFLEKTLEAEPAAEALKGIQRKEPPQ